jgi:hypothetical protein
LAVLSAAKMRAAASGLRMLRTTLDGFAVDLETMRAGARTRLDEADAAWSGPRSERTLGAVRGYLGRLDPAFIAIGTITGGLGTLASVGDTVATELEAVEASRQRAAQLLASDDPEVRREAESIRSGVDSSQASCEEAWRSACSAAPGRSTVRRQHCRRSRVTS